MRCHHGVRSSAVTEKEEQEPWASGRGGVWLSHGSLGDGRGVLGLQPEAPSALAALGPHPSRQLILHAGKVGEMPPFFDRGWRKGAIAQKDRCPVPGPAGD